MAHGAQIIVGTPGRTMDLLGRCPGINLKTLEVNIYIYLRALDIPD